MAFSVAELRVSPSFGVNTLEIKVLSSGAATAVLPELVPDFERVSGVRVSIAYASTNRIMSRIRDGETADVAILNDAGIAELEQQGILLPGSRVDLARTGLGIAVRKGAAKPDISTVEAFKRALLNARSIARTATGASGVYFAGLIERLGLAEALKPRIHVISGGLVGEIVARGEVELGVQMMSEILAVPGADLVGPLPAELQSMSLLSACIFAATPHPAAAKTLIRFLATPEAARIMAAKGLEPVKRSAP